MPRVPATAALLAITMLAGVRPAAASPGEITWTTWFRIGPGRNYAVRDEVPNSTVVEVLGCDNGWCRVIFGGWIGYVESSVVQQPPAANATASAGPHDCVSTRQDGYGKGDALRICER